MNVDIVITNIFNLNKHFSFLFLFFLLLLQINNSEFLEFYLGSRIWSMSMIINKVSQYWW